MSRSIAEKIHWYHMVSNAFPSTDFSNYSRSLKLSSACSRIDLDLSDAPPWPA